MKIEEMDEFIESWKRLNDIKIYFKISVIRANTHKNLYILREILHFKLNEYIKQIKINN